MSATTAPKCIVIFVSLMVCLVVTVFYSGDNKAVDVTLRSSVRVANAVPNDVNLGRAVGITTVLPNGFETLVGDRSQPPVHDPSVTAPKTEDVTLASSSPRAEEESTLARDVEVPAAKGTDSLPQWCSDLPWSSNGAALDDAQKKRLCREMAAFSFFNYGQSSSTAFEDRIAMVRDFSDGQLCGISVAVFGLHQGYCDGFTQITDYFLKGSATKELMCDAQSKKSMRVPKSGVQLIDGDAYISKGAPLPSYDITFSCVSFSPAILRAHAKSARVTAPVLARDMFWDKLIMKRESYHKILNGAISIGTNLPDAQVNSEFGRVFINALTREVTHVRREDPSVAPIVYISSHCGVKFRDTFVRELMKHIKIDSVGACMNNKQKVSDKQHRYDNQTDEFVRQYKFMIAAENTDCGSYCSEKPWMTLARGIVPIVHGCRAVKELMPKDSVIHTSDFASPAQLAAHIKSLLADPAAYAKLLAWRKPGRKDAGGDEWQQRFATGTWGTGGGNYFYRALAENKWGSLRIASCLFRHMVVVSKFVDLSKALSSYRGSRKRYLSVCHSPNPNEDRYFPKFCRSRNRELPSLPAWSGRAAGKCRPLEPWLNLVDASLT